MLESAILAGNARLDGAASGGPVVKRAPPADEPEAVRRIQQALAALGFALPRSFPAGPAGAPDGRFGTETHEAVLAFQRREFPRQPDQWDGRVGRNTLARLDRLLPRAAAEESVELQPLSVMAVTNCAVRAPA